MYTTIVVGTDGSPGAEQAVRHALDLAQALGSTVHVVTAWQPVPPLALSGQMGAPPPMPLDDGAWVTALHDAVVAQGKALGVTVVPHSVQEGAAHALLDVARSVDASVIVVGNTGMRGLLGHLPSTTSTVAHKATCAVLVVPSS
jgi:nucleotide-binding universal stress UspA family protein